MKIMQLLLVLLFSPLLAAAVTLDDGEQVALEQPARRIVSLAPHITELLFAVGAGEHIVGTVEHSDFPRAARQLPRIGNHQALDLEAIMALKPDLVLAWSGANPQAALDKLQLLGLRVHVSPSFGLADIAANLRHFARMAGVASRGEEVASHFERLLAELRQQYGGRRPVSVFMQIWEKPLMTVNGRHFISEVITLCGGVNIFADLDSLAPGVATEAVIERNPEVIVVNGQGAQYQQWLNAWRAWPQVHAVRRANLYGLKAHTIARPTPRILMGAKNLCRILDTVRQPRPVPEQ